jgi:hypothetical protein
MAIANIVKSSLGPVGLDKMLVDDIGDVTITNDGATILQQLEVEHPAAKVLVELAHLQDQEVGDGTTSVVIVAAELLKRGNELVMNKVHPTSIISGYRLALKEAVRFIKDKLVVSVDQVRLGARRGRLVPGMSLTSPAPTNRDHHTYPPRKTSHPLHRFFHISILPDHVKHASRF